MASDVMNIGTFFWGALGTKTNKKVLECCAVLCHAICLSYLRCVWCVWCVCIVFDTPIRIAHLVSRTS